MDNDEKENRKMYCLAIDIGASSGRHILATLNGGKMELKEIYRFDNGFEKKNGKSVWNIDNLFKSVVEGIKKCKEYGVVPDTIGIDTWGVDYALLDGEDKLIGDVIAYRDERTFKSMVESEKVVPFSELYAKCGIQRLNYNTVYQLYDDLKSGKLDKAESMLMVPEYLNFLLTGVKKNEYTNASTTSLLNANDRTWDYELIEKYGFPKKLFKKLYEPCEEVGGLKEEIAKEVGFNSKVVLSASHDTASAVMAVPAETDMPLFISSGTWSLLGVEIPEPITSENAFKFNMTNEGGYGRSIRFLKNIMGLWMIQNIKREYKNEYSYEDLMLLAKAEDGFENVIDVNDDSFLAPDSMIEAVKNYCKTHGLVVPDTVGKLMSTVYVSLAKYYVKAIEALEIITGRKFEVINIVGGGSKDRYLSELTKRYSGKRVISGPTEGTAIGNILAQMLSLNMIKDLKEGREIIKKSFEIKEI